MDTVNLLQLPIQFYTGLSHSAQSGLLIFFPGQFSSFSSSHSPPPPRFAETVDRLVLVWGISDPPHSPSPLPSPPPTNGRMRGHHANREGGKPLGRDMGEKNKQKLIFFLLTVTECKKAK
jgi:hypothetical protein